MAGSRSKCVTCTREIVGLPCIPILSLDSELSLLLVTDRQEKKEKNVNEVMKDLLDRFYKLVNGLLNAKGGAVILHSESQHVLEQFDQKVDAKLDGLIPDNSFYHEVFERYHHDEKHIIYVISPMSQIRPISTLDFRSKSSQNKGKVAPTHGQMSSFLVQLKESEETGNNKSCQNKWKFEHGQPVVYVGKFQKAFQESTCIQAKAVPENTSNLSKHCFDIAKEYITSFTKMTNGGSIYFGVGEHKEKTDKEVWTAAVQPPFTLASLTQQVQGARNVSTQEPCNQGRGGEAPVSAGHGRGVAGSCTQPAAAGPGRGRCRGRVRGQSNSQPPGTRCQAQPATTGNGENQRHDTSRAQQSPAAQNNPNVQNTSVSQWQIWQDQDDNRTKPPTVYYVSKLPKRQCEEKQTGEFRTQGVLLPKSDHQSFRQKIQDQACKEMMWFGDENPKDIIEVEFHPIANKSDYYVIELKVGHYHGLCFHDKNGPLAYRADLQQQCGPVQKQQPVKPVGVEEWAKSFVRSASEDVQSAIRKMNVQTPCFSP